MALQSQRFGGDPKLEAAAVADEAHIVRGASGVHVGKIQSALIELDGATIAGRELELALYGPSTAAAVLAFKTKRKIVNPAYQTQPDDIVGKMTIAALDSEMLKKEGETTRPVRLEAITQRRCLSQKAYSPTTPQRNPILPSAFGYVGAPRLHVDNIAIDIPLFGVGSFRVVDGVGGQVSCDKNIGVLFDPSQSLSAGSSFAVTRNPQVVYVRGLNPGVSFISYQKPFISLLQMPLPITLIVRAPIKKQREFVAGVQHNHTPSGKWAEVSKHPTNLLGGAGESSLIGSVLLTPICKFCSTPKCVVDKVIALLSDSLEVTKLHIDWYLRSGGGRDYNEDGNISTWIRVDAGIRRALQNEFRSGRKSGFFEFDSHSYENADYQNSFGSIDRVDFEFDLDHDECTIWFKDRYEWHPVYRGLYEQKGDDYARPTNCLHAAMVEMQSQGARDFWMVGEATVPMVQILEK